MEELWLIAMGGKVALQVAHPDGTGVTLSIGRSKTIPGGYYLLSAAEAPQSGRSYTGVILVQHDGYVYQQTDGTGVVRYPEKLFSGVSFMAGDSVVVTYDSGRINVTPLAQGNATRRRR